MIGLAVIAAVSLALVLAWDRAGELRREAYLRAGAGALLGAALAGYGAAFAVIVWGLPAR